MKLGIQLSKLQENKPKLWKAYVDKLNRNLQGKQKKEQKKKEFGKAYYKTKKEDKKQ